MISPFLEANNVHTFANRALVDDSKIFVKRKGAAFQMSAEEEEEERILDELRYMDLPEEGSEFPNLESDETLAARGNRAFVTFRPSVLVADHGPRHSSGNGYGFANHRSMWSGFRSSSSTSALYFSRYSCFQ